MAPYQPLSTFKLGTGMQTTTPMTKTIAPQKKAAVVPWKDTPEGQAFQKAHAQTTDEKGNVIQMNGKNVAPTSSPYNPLTIQNQINKGEVVKAITGMGTPAKQPTVAEKSNVITPKDAAPSFNLSNYADPSKLAQGTQIMGQAGYSTTGGKVAPTNVTTGSKTGNVVSKGDTSADVASTNKNATDVKTDKTSRQGLLTSLVDQSTQRNRQLADRAQEIASSAGQTMSDIGRQGARGEAGYRTTGTSPVGEGNAAVLAQTTAAQQQAVAQGAQTELQGVGYGLTGQSQTQSALNQALGYQQPVAGATFFGSPDTGGLVGGAGAGGQTGYTGNQLIDGSVQKAYDMLKGGKTTWDAAKATLVGGSVAEQALLARLTSGFSPTATNAAVTTNLSMGGDYATQATELSKNLDTFKAQGPKVIDFLQQTGINKNTGVWSNSVINDLLANLNPSYKGIADNYFNELQVSTAQILGRTGQITPTQVTEMSNTQTLRAMTPAELESYISYIDSLGQTNLGELQKKASEAGGSQFYQGSQADPNVQTSLAPSGTMGGAVAQTGLGIIPNVVGWFTRLFTKI